MKCRVCSEDPKDWTNSFICDKCRQDLEEIRAIEEDLKEQTRLWEIQDEMS